MSESTSASGPQFRADRPPEQEAVRTTIVGGRPPGSGQPVGVIPRGIEVLVKKASVDPGFNAVLLAERAEAARLIGLTLDPAEAMMLALAPREQLEAVIAQTTVPEEHRRTFLGQAAAVMLAALGVMNVGCEKGPGPKGIAPDRVPGTGNKPAPAVTGIAPDRVPGTTEKGPPAPQGIRPDLPSKADGPGSKAP